jgi:hypothetical protein
LTIAWSQPNSHSASILQYQILFRKVDGTYVEDLTDCDGS